MKSLTEYLKTNKKFLLISALILALILAAALINSFFSEESAYGGELKSAEELQLMRILSRIEGVGDADVMITQDEQGVAGVVIVCEGADNIMVRSDVLNAVSTAFNIDKNNIAVYAMN